MRSTSVPIAAQELDLFANQLSGTIPASLSALSALTWFNVRNNYLGGTLFDFSLMQGLVYVRTQHC
jgi:hypothetical protein